MSVGRSPLPRKMCGPTVSARAPSICVVWAARESVCTRTPEVSTPSDFEICSPTGGGSFDPGPPVGAGGVSSGSGCFSVLLPLLVCGGGLDFGFSGRGRRSGGFGGGAGTFAAGSATEHRRRAQRADRPDLPVLAQDGELEVAGVDHAAVLEREQRCVEHCVADLATRELAARRELVEKLRLGRVVGRQMELPD